MDPLQAEALLKYLLDRHETAVVSLHNRQLALDHFDRIMVLRDGRLCCDCPARELSAARLDEFYPQYSSPASEVPEPENDGWVIRTS